MYSLGPSRPSWSFWYTDSPSVMNDAATSSTGITTITVHTSRVTSAIRVGRLGHLASNRCCMG